MATIVVYSRGTEVNRIQHYPYMACMHVRGFLCWCNPREMSITLRAGLISSLVMLTLVIAT